MKLNDQELSPEQREAARQYSAEALLGRVAKYISLEDQISVAEAFNKLYHTDLPEKIFDWETKLYLEGPGYLYELYKDTEFF
ncbi:MAG: hypothetical protein LBM13_03520 [Candidatus Ancillula sp.]|jgi:hypothetical protein|nr:hypothetical protein [Candidatus Ancillula sp.]